MEHARQPTRVRRRLTIVNEDAAGLDVGATFHVVAIPADRDAEPVRTFQSFTADLHALADWLQSVGIRTIAMESTGVYWIPVYEILEQRGFEVLLVNAREPGTFPGARLMSMMRSGSNGCTSTACCAAAFAHAPTSRGCAPTCGTVSGSSTTPPRTSSTCRRH